MAADELIPWINSAGEGGVRNSMQEYPGTGTNGPFEFNFAGGYIDQSHVKAYRYDPISAQTYPQALAFVGPNQVTTSDVIPKGQFVVVYRDTPKNRPLVDYSEGAVMDEANLDKSNDQAVFAAAEMVDRFDSINSTSAEAITRSVLAYNTANDALGLSHQALDASANAVSTAKAADSKANSATATANDAHDIAVGIDAKAQSALDASANAVSTANSAKTTANGIDAKAQSALDTSGTALTKASAASADASTALSTANSVSSKADTALSTANAAKSSADAAAASVNDKLSKSGGSVTGDMTFDQNLGGQVIFKYGDNTKYVVMRGAPALPGWVVTDAAGNHLLRTNLSTNGVEVPSGPLTVNSGQTYLNGRTHIQPGPGAGNGEFRWVASNGVSMCVRARPSGGVEFINNAYNAVVHTIDDAGTVTMPSGGVIGTDGNVYWTGRGWISSLWGRADDAWNKANDAQANRADRGAQVRWNSGINEFGRVTTGSSGNGTMDSGDPWVMCGVRMEGWGLIGRAVWLRNN